MIWAVSTYRVSKLRAKAQNKLSRIRALGAAFTLGIFSARTRPVFILIIEIALCTQLALCIRVILTRLLFVLSAAVALCTRLALCIRVILTLLRQKFGRGYVGINALFDDTAEHVLNFLVVQPCVKDLVSMHVH
jgi:hypothetical protein